MMPTLTIIEMAVARAVTTMDVRAREAARLRPAMRPAAPVIRRRMPREAAMAPVTKAGEISAVAAMAKRW
jgi:hypothetical protein